jgi:TRAP-type transport system periplasmic protein
MKTWYRGKQTLVILVIVMVLMSLALSCGGKTTTSAPAAPAPAPSAAKPLEMVFSSNTPVSAPMSADEQKFFDLVTQKSGGRIKFTTYWASTLMPDKESWNGMLAGTADFLHWVASEDYQKLNWGIMNMPFIGWPSMEIGGEINMKLVEKFPAMKNEFKGAAVLGIRMMPAVQIHTVKKQVKTPDDLKGMKIICTGAMAKFVNSIGGVPTDVQVGDMYTALNSGLTDGNINHWPVVAVFGTLPLYKYHTNFGDGGIQMLPMGIVGNPKSWAKIPADIQKIMIDTYNEVCVVGGYKMDYGEIAKYTKQAQDTGHTIVNLTPAEIKVWQDACAPLQQQWLKDFSAFGPANDIFNEAKNMIAQYTK